jgi:integrase
MVLLASRLGLRASDIAGLQFSDIDWDRNTITITMQKTEKVIELPLLADVGNAIIDYLRHGRRNPPLQNVFISERAPYVAATPEMVSNAIRAIVIRSGVDTSSRHHGPHSLRHSLASAMLDGTCHIGVFGASQHPDHADIPEDRHPFPAEVRPARARGVRQFLYAERRCILWLSSLTTAVYLRRI